MIQKQEDYYHARFNFSFNMKDGTVPATAERLLQRCNFDPNPSCFSPEALKFYLIPQLMAVLKYTPLQPQSVDFINSNEQWGNKHPYWFVQFGHPRIVATLQRYMPSNQCSMTLHYHSHQFDEYYAFCGLHPTLINDFNFWDRTSALTEIMLRCKGRKFEPIDYSTALIPE